MHQQETERRVEEVLRAARCISGVDLCSDIARDINGQVLPLDGGWSAT